MSATSTPMGSDFPRQMIDLLFNAIKEGNKQAARMLWTGLQSLLSQHWLLFIGVLFLVFVAVTFTAMMGRWGSLGSFLFNFLYFGTLYVIGLIWGPEIFVNDIFNAVCTVILYPVCYLVVGSILAQTGIKRRRL